MAFTQIACNITNIVTDSPCQKDYLQFSFYGLLFLVGFLVNAAALYAFIVQRKSWTDTHVYMFNVSIADTALILFLPFRVYDALFCLEKNGFCTFLISTHFINMYASIMTTAAISVHRYLAIKFPMQTRSWRKKKKIAFAVCLVIWGLLVIINIIYHDQNHPEKLWTCYERCKNLPLNPTLIGMMVFVGYFIPLLIVVFCSSQIIYVLSKVKDKSKQRKSTIGIVTANMIVFIVCYTPIHISFLVNYYYPVPTDWQHTSLPAHTYLLVSEWIASTNCCFDSISYFFLLKRFYS
ncbi:G-protein coupled receptor 35 [Collichthys lucidus]|uniref:G-protein coupled receptor 35 n=1 Tax=Collichthys lucidus TaxID=240159 RepID=A0A4U5UXE8_COLLU|nr:G-protein coupled receptor 35 [Collichthys lucidus]